MAKWGMRSRLGKLEGAARLVSPPLRDPVFREWRAWYEPLLALLEECAAPAEVVEGIRRPVEINERAMFSTQHIPAPINGVDGRIWWLRQTAIHNLSRAMGLSGDQWNAMISGARTPDAETPTGPAPSEDPFEQPDDNVPPPLEV